MSDLKRTRAHATDSSDAISVYTTTYYLLVVVV